MDGNRNWWSHFLRTSCSNISPGRRKFAVTPREAVALACFERGRSLELLVFTHLVARLVGTERDGTHRSDRMAMGRNLTLRNVAQCNSLWM